VRGGDRLHDIARSHRTTVLILAALNGIENPDRIDEGHVLAFPEPIAARD